jgi:hypothetical protein
MRRRWPVLAATIPMALGWALAAAHRAAAAGLAGPGGQVQPGGQLQPGGQVQAGGRLDQQPWRSGVLTGRGRRTGSKGRR